MAVRVRECRLEQIVAKEQPGMVQQLADQRRTAAVETGHDQLFAQGPSPLWPGTTRLRRRGSLWMIDGRNRPSSLSSSITRQSTMATGFAQKPVGVPEVAVPRGEIIYILSGLLVSLEGHSNASLPLSLPSGELLDVAILSTGSRGDRSVAGQ